MKEYIKPELEIDLFEDIGILCDVIGESGSGEGGFEGDWFKPEFEDE